MKNITKNPKGVSLVEVVIATAIVAAVSLAVVGAMSQGSIFSRNIDTMYTATYIAQRRIDVLKRFEFEQLALAEESGTIVGADGNIDPDGGYSRTTEVATEYDNNPNLASVKVSVRRLRLLPGGNMADLSGDEPFAGNPVVMETLFSSVQ
jgi:prepilin-type N-terminal cleavage/methylation domain-containing protein